MENLRKTEEFSTQKRHSGKLKDELAILSKLRYVECMFPLPRGSDAENQEDMLVEYPVCGLLTYFPCSVGMREYIFGIVKMTFLMTAETHRNNGGTGALVLDSNSGKSRISVPRAPYCSQWHGLFHGRTSLEATVTQRKALKLALFR